MENVPEHIAEVNLEPFTLLTDIMTLWHQYLGTGTIMLTPYSPKKYENTILVEEYDSDEDDEEGEASLLLSVAK